MARIHRLLTWPAAFYIAGILLWYEQYKLTGDPGSVWLFNVLADWLHISGYEKPVSACSSPAWKSPPRCWCLLPWTAFMGPPRTRHLGVMSGAIFFHLVSPLGIDPYHDGGALFREACAVWLCSGILFCCPIATKRKPSSADC